MVVVQLVDECDESSSFVSSGDGELRHTREEDGVIPDGTEHIESLS